MARKPSDRIEPEMSGLYEVWNDPGGDEIPTFIGLARGKVDDIRFAYASQGDSIVVQSASITNVEDLTAMRLRVDQAKTSAMQLERELDNHIRNLHKQKGTK